MTEDTLDNEGKLSWKRILALREVEDLASKFMYYDRKEDEDLPRGDIEFLVSSGKLTVKELVNKFEESLVSYLA